MSAKNHSYDLDFDLDYDLNLDPDLDLDFYLGLEGNGFLQGPSLSDLY